MNSLREQEEEIFELYLARGVAPLVRDGALSESYLSQSLRILFILKEANDPDKSWENPDLRDFGFKYNRPATWSNLALWTALAHDPAISFRDANRAIRTPEERREYLQKTAVVNVKKTAGGPRSIARELRQAAEKNPDLLKRQFALYGAHIIVACGTFKILKNLLKDRMVEEGQKVVSTGEAYRFLRDQQLGLVLDFWHPQSMKSREQMFEDFRELLAHHGHSTPPDKGVLVP